MKPASISEDELLNLINKLNNDDNVDGLLVQLPLPGEFWTLPLRMISEERILSYFIHLAPHVDLT